MGCEDGVTWPNPPSGRARGHFLHTVIRAEGFPDGSGIGLPTQDAMGSPGELGRMDHAGSAAPLYIGGETTWPQQSGRKPVKTGLSP
jgi:hypothetical protein